MTAIVMAMFWAAAMFLLAILARVGLADRDTVQLLLMIMPILAWTTISGLRCRKRQEA
ncbi:MAG: hypothetical protein ABIO29_03315 [Sphingomicrobium sp.]